MSTDQEDKDRASSAIDKLAGLSLLTLTVTALRFGSRLIKNVVFTRLLGPAERGIFGLLTTIPDLIVCSGDMGLGVGAMYLAAKRRYHLGKIVGNTLLLAFLLGMLMSGAGYLLLSREWIIKGQGEAIREFVPVVLFLVPFVLLQKFGEDLLIATEEIRFLNVLNFLFSTVPILALIALYLLTGEALRSAMYAWGSAVVLFGVCAMARVSALCKWKLGASLPCLREMFSYGVRVTGGIVAGVFVRRIDFLMVSAMLGPEALGYYAISVSIAEIVLALPEAVNLPFLPIRLGMDKKDGRSVTPVVTRTMLFIMASTCAVVAMFSGFIITLLFGQKFLPAEGAVLWLLPGIVMWSVHEVLKTELYSHDKPGFVSVEAGATLLCNVALNFILIPLMGIKGAALSSSIAYTLGAAILLVKFSSLSGVPIHNMLLISREDISGFKRAFRRRRQAP